MRSNRFTGPLLALAALLLSVMLSGCEEASENVQNIIEENPVIVVEDKKEVSIDDDATCTDDEEVEKSGVLEAEESMADESKEDKPDEKPGDWVEALKIAENTSQIITVVATGNTATVEFHEKDEDIWSVKLKTQAKIGENGIGKSKEGDRKTPRGIMRFVMAFGAKSNPGSNISYIQVDDNCLWVDDPNSVYYNKFVDANSVSKDWNSAEKLKISTSSYNYALATDYNSDCIPGNGSAIFMHCLPTGGAGCIAIPEEDMRQLITLVDLGCVLLVDSQDGIMNY